MVEIDDADELKAPLMRLIRSTRPKHEILEPNQLRALVEAASPILKAVTFLGLNAAYINVDCCRLTLAEARQGVKVGFLLGQRVKTSVDRCAVLWPETIAEDRTLDAVAVRHVMGHADHSISQVYRDRVLYARIEKACNAVRDWYLTPEKFDQASHSVTKSWV